MLGPAQDVEGRRRVGDEHGAGADVAQAEHGVRVEVAAGRAQGQEQPIPISLAVELVQRDHLAAKLLEGHVAAARGPGEGVLLDHQLDELEVDAAAEAVALELVAQVLEHGLVAIAGRRPVERVGVGQGGHGALLSKALEHQRHVPGWTRVGTQGSRLGRDRRTGTGSESEQDREQHTGRQAEEHRLTGPNPSAGPVPF